MTQPIMEWAFDEGSLYYRETKRGLCIVSVSGNPLRVEVPETIGDIPVIAIEKKAFLSKKQLKKVTLPGTIKEVGDWAFAYCDGLEEVVIPTEDFTFGKAVFLDCKNLKSLQVGKKTAGIDALLAATATLADLAYLLQPKEAGSVSWLKQWDAGMLRILHTPDSDGYSKQVLCGEEDYGSTDMAAYLSGRRSGKVRLLLLRLLHDHGMAEEIRREITEYLAAHTKGCKHEETWQVILKDHGNHREYYELLDKIGGVNSENLSGMMEDMGEDYPEMKAYFMKIGQGISEEKDIFENFLL